MNHPLDALFDQFLKERRYLKNVTEATLVWYRMAFSNYTSFVADEHPPPPTIASLQGFLMDTNGGPEREGNTSISITTIARVTLRSPV